MIVKHTKPCITYVDRFFFYPGMNTFNEEDSAILMADEAFLARVKCGNLEIIGNDSGKITKTITPTLKVSAAKISIKGMPLTSAIKVIEATYNVVALRELAGTDQRKGIQDAIANQLKKIDDQKVINDAPKDEE